MNLQTSTNPSMNSVRRPLLEDGSINTCWLYTVSGAFAKPLYFLLLDGLEPILPDEVPTLLGQFCERNDSNAIVAFLVKQYGLNHASMPQEMLEILACDKAVIPFARELITDFTDIGDEEHELLLDESN